MPNLCRPAILLINGHKPFIFSDRQIFTELYPLHDQTPDSAAPAQGQETALRGQPVATPHDNRPEARAQAARQKAADNSPRVGYLNGLRQMADRATVGQAPKPAPVNNNAPVQRKLICDGNEVNDMAALGDAYKDTVKALMDVPATINLKQDELMEVHGFLATGKKPESRPAKVAVLQLISDGAWTKTAVTTVAAKHTLNVYNDKKQFENLGNLGGFLKQNPNLGGNLRAAGGGWEINSSHNLLGGFGGGAVINDKVHLQDWVLGEDPADKGFMRMAVHEAGHATFQRMLITNEDWTDENDKGKQHPSDKSLVEDGKRFYQAWKVLSQRPEYMMVTDMPGDAPDAKGAGRAKYLAGKFSEFCAESFMHMALEKPMLENHVANIPDDQPVVKSAWNEALAVLKKYEGRMLGNDQAEGEKGREAIKVHRFNKVVGELKKGLAGPEMETSAKPDELQNLLENVRKVWALLSAEERAKVRPSALTAIDQYFMKVRRRRPAQEHFGKESGMEGL